MKRAFVSLCLLSCSAALLAQTSARSEDPFSRHLYPLDLVMAHQGDLELSDAQRTALRRDMLAAQTAFTETQWRLGDEAEKLARLLAGSRVDQAAVLAQMDRVLSIEQELKKHQMTLVVRVKNILTAEQQAKLDAIRAAAERSAARAIRGGGGGGGGGRRPDPR